MAGLVCPGLVPHCPGLAMFIARSGIEEQRGAVARLVAPGDGHELVPRHQGNLRVAEPIPVLPDKLEAVVVAAGQGAATVDDHALQVVLAEVPPHLSRDFHAVVKTHRLVEADALCLLVHQACAGLVLALGQADCQAGWQGCEARAPLWCPSTIRVRPVEESVEEFLDGRLGVGAGGHGKHAQGQDVSWSRLEVLVATRPHQSPVPGPRRIGAKEGRQITEEATEESCRVFLAGEGEAVSEPFVEHGPGKGRVRVAHQRRHGLGQEAAHCGCTESATAG